MLRRRRLRHPVLFWLVAVALTALTVSTVARATASADDARARWGRLRPVVVARHALEPGQPLRDTDVRLVPAALVPAGAIRSARGQTVAAWIAAGEVVVADRLAPRGVSAVVARLPAGTRGIAVPVGQAPLPVEPGDVVDVIATDDTSASTIAIGAVVVAVDDAAVTIAVETGDAEAVALAVTSGSVTLTISAAR